MKDRAVDHGVPSGEENVLKDGDNKYRSVTPPDLNDPPKFSQIREALKDTFVKSLQDFFAQEFVDQDKIDEIPNITTFESSEDGPYRSARFIRRHFGKNEDLPQIVIYTSSGSAKRYAFNNTFIDRILPNPRVTTAPGPFIFPERAFLTLRTKPSKPGKWQNTVINIPPGEITAENLVNLINEQSMLVRAEVGDNQEVHIYADGALQRRRPRVIEVVPSDDFCSLDQLGLIFQGVGCLTGNRPNATLTDIGAFDEVRDDKQRIVITDPRYRINNTSTVIKRVTSDTVEYENKGLVSEDTIGEQVCVTYQILKREDHLSKRIPPLNRYCHRRLSNVVVQVLAKDEQTREELADIILTYYDFIMQENFYTYWGREIDNIELSHNERFQIVLQPNNQNSPEQEMKRTSDEKDKLYILQLTIPVEIMYYIDRELVIQEGVAAGESYTLEGDNISVTSSVKFGSSIN